jgi:hypothetical protein
MCHIDESLQRQRARLSRVPDLLKTMLDSKPSVEDMTGCLEALREVMTEELKILRDLALLESAALPRSELN